MANDNASAKKFKEQCGIKQEEVLRIVRDMLTKYERGDASVRICRMSNGKAYVMGNRAKTMSAKAGK
ncbi:MAG: hypothetical protein WAL71_09260 [Terriglobales bacterium]|jgi:hypothetical protein